MRRGYVWWLEPGEPQRQVQRLRLCQWSLYQVPVEPWCGYWWRTVKRDNGPVAFLDLSVCKWRLVNLCQKNGREQGHKSATTASGRRRGAFGRMPKKYFYQCPHKHCGFDARCVKMWSRLLRAGIRLKHAISNIQKQSQIFLRTPDSNQRRSSSIASSFKSSHKSATHNDVVV